MLDVILFGSYRVKYITVDKQVLSEGDGTILFHLLDGDDERISRSEVLLPQAPT